jgi:DNA sulfur modification protein DndC
MRNNLFTGAFGRLQMNESIELTAQSLKAYGPNYEHWCAAWSGGKDSTTVVLVTIYLIATGKVKAPKTFTIEYADTRLELTPLAIAAKTIIEELAEHGYSVDVVMATLENRFLTYMLGRGVPPPNNATFRWCTSRIKIEPMIAALERLSVNNGYGYYTSEGKFRSHDEDIYESNIGYRAIKKAIRSIQTIKKEKLSEKSKQDLLAGLMQDLKAQAKLLVPNPKKILMITGVRQGESAIRDKRIVMSCGKNGAECGQGWYQETMPENICDTLAPILHWRVCHVWEWLKHWAPLPEYGDFSTELIADAYGGNEAEEINARTGCMGCPLTDKDTALDNLLKTQKWAYLAPIKRLRPVFRWLREPANRLRKTGLEESNEKNKQRMGPLTMAARKKAFEQILAIQNEININADLLNRPKVDLLNDEEQDFIKKCWDENLWPNKWNGDEPTGDVLMDHIYSNGVIQPLLFYTA